MNSNYSTHLIISYSTQSRGQKNTKTSHFPKYVCQKVIKGAETQRLMRCTKIGHSKKERVCESGDWKLIVRWPTKGSGLMLPLTLMQWVVIKVYADAEFLLLASLSCHIPVNTHSGQQSYHNISTHLQITMHRNIKK